MATTAACMTAGMPPRPRASTNAPDPVQVMWAPYRVLRIKRAAYRAAQEAANLGPVIGYQARPHITHLSSAPFLALC